LGPIDGAARFVAHHDEKRGLQVFGAVLDAGEHGFVGDLPGGPYDEQLAEAGVEDHLRRHARVGAREHDGKRRLPAHLGLPPFGIDRQRRRGVLHESGVAGDEPLQRAGGRVAGTDGRAPDDGQHERGDDGSDVSHVEASGQ
jgi:hypothetical protein